jgi:hypothetical protein
MQILETTNGRPLDTVIVEHQGETVTFDTTVYSKTTKIDFKEIFGFLNAYWAQLPMDRQDGIFRAYVLAMAHFESIFDNGKLGQHLMDVAATIYNLMPPEELRNWVIIKSGIQYPTDLKLELPAEDLHNEEKVKMTYLRHDYIDLVIMSLALRPMIPIWGEYINRQGVTTGNTYKELSAVRMLRKTWIMVSEPMQRLRIYLECTCKRQDKSDSAVLDGLGTAEMPDWLMGLAVVRRLVCVELSSLDRADSIIAKIFNFINNSTLRSMDRRFDGLVNDKKSSGSTEEGDNTSMLEGYKIKQPFCDGDLVTVNVYTENIEGMAQFIDPSIDLAKLHMCLDTIQSHEGMNVEDHHRVLCQWTAAVAISAKSIDNLDKASILRVMACVQATLWHWGFYDLAIMVTATPIDNLTMGADIERRVSPPKIQRLISIFKHFYPHNKSANDTLEKLARTNNVGLEAVEIATRSMLGRQWQSNAPKPLHALGYTQGKYRKFHIPANTRDLLADLIIKVATRPEWIHGTDE